MAKQRKKGKIKFSMGKGYKGKTIWKCFKCRKIFEAYIMGGAWSEGPICVACFKKGIEKAKQRLKKKKRRIKFSLK